MKKQTIYLSLSFLSLVMAGISMLAMYTIADNQTLIGAIIAFTLSVMIGTLSMSSYLHYKTQ
jgi:hypothetical protein